VASRSPPSLQPVFSILLLIGSRVQADGFDPSFYD
jgi:hypothetical protein